MTIQVPDDLARDLERIAATQKKTVEQVTLERCALCFDAANSPEAFLRAFGNYLIPALRRGRSRSCNCCSTAASA